MLRSVPPVTQPWVVVAGMGLFLLALAGQSLADADRQPWLGVQATRVGPRLVVDWVQPAGWAWDAGVRPGDVVAAVDGGEVDAAMEPAAVASARSLRVLSGGGLVSVPAGPAPVPESDVLRWSFLFTAFWFLAVGGAVFVLSTERRAARLMLVLAFSAATMLVAAVGTPSGAAWAVVTVYVSVVTFACTSLLLFLVFPIDRLGSAAARRVAAGAVLATAGLLAAYVWVFVAAPAAYEVLQKTAFATIAVELTATAGLILLAWLRSSPHQRQARGALQLVALGAVSGLAPFCFLSLGPYLLGLGYLIPPDVSILTVGLLPTGLGAAAISRQFFGVTRLVRRGLVALLVWGVLLGAYGAALQLVLRSVFPAAQGAPALGRVVLVAAMVGGSFPIVQTAVRRRLEEWLFHDVYSYPETVRRLGSEIGRLSTLDAIASHVLRQLIGTMDLAWAAIDLGDEAVGRYRWLGRPDDAAGGEPLRSRRAADESGPDRDVDLEPPEAAPEQAEFALVAEGERIGTLSVGPKRHDCELLSEDRALLATIAPLVAPALRSALLVQHLAAQVDALAEREHELATLNARLVEVQEEERRRLALDLHDEPLQRAILVARSLRDGPWLRDMPALMGEMEDLIASLRATCNELRPASLDDFGLVGGLEQLVNHVRAQSELSAGLILEPPDMAALPRLPAELETALYRVAQEALNNCLRHAQASQVLVHLVRRDDCVELRVVDDGRGLHAATAEQQSRSGLGILGMRERLRPWNGRIRLEASPGGGTTMHAEVGLRERETAGAD